MATVFLLFAGPGSAPDDPTSSNPTRRRLLEIIRELRGINATELGKRAGFPRNAIRHHLRILIEVGLVKRYELGRESHYFPSETPNEDMPKLASARHGRAWLVLREILLRPGIGQQTLAKQVNMTRKVLRYHLDLLLSHNLIEEYTKTRFRRYYPGRDVEPGAWDRFFKSEGSASKPPEKRDALAPEHIFDPLRRPFSPWS